MSSNRRSPRKIALAPGSPSPVRPRKPPNLAIQRTARPRQGRARGGVGVRRIVQHNARQSCGANATVQGATGRVRAAYVSHGTRHAAVEYVATVRSSRSTVCNWSCSTRPPNLST